MSTFFKWYSASVKRSPRITNGVMTGTLFGIGDVIAQLGFPEKKDQKYDIVRTARGVVYGSLIFSLIGDKWYKFLNEKIKLRPGEHWANTVARVACDQLIFAPVGIPMYYTVMGFLEGKSMLQVKKKVEDNWWSTLVTNWYVWPAFQMLNFSLVPVQHRLLSVNLISIFWNAFLSFKNSMPSSDSPLPTASTAEAKQSSTF